ncbi:MAG: aminotransferase class IV [Rickettsiaceae bacterium]|nr:aminotransferase class IV [Rickettsiaceae bacterium]
MTISSIIPLENLNFTLWLDGKYINSLDAKIHILTHSMQYAGGVYEGVKAKDGYIFKLEEHTTRLFESARMMRLDIPFSHQEIVDVHHELLRLNNLQNAYFRPFVWRQTDSVRILPSNPRSHIIIAAWNMALRSAESIRVNVSNWVKPGKNMFPHGCKASAQYGLLAIAAMEARDQGFDDSIMLDEKGFIAECTSANIFFIKEGALYTPKTDYCLDGITRRSVIEIAKKEEIECFVQDISPSDLSSFDSAFITGTAVEVREICHILFGVKEINYQASEIFQKIKNIYQKMIRGINE